MKKLKVVGLNFDHMHMGDLLRQCHEHPGVEIAGICEGRIGALQEVHYYDGNRGPLWHAADKIETTPTPAMKRKSWFYKKAAGGGSLLDYLGYGTTLGTWFHDGEKPLEVSAVVDRPRGLDVDEHSITIAR